MIHVDFTGLINEINHCHKQNITLRIAGIKRIAINFLYHSKRYKNTNAIYFNRAKRQYNTILEDEKELIYNFFYKKDINLTAVVDAINKNNNKTVFKDGDSIFLINFFDGRLIEFSNIKNKYKGIKIFGYIHDILPITHPHYFTKDLFVGFQKRAKLAFDIVDYFFASTHFTQKQIENYFKEKKINKPVYVSPYGFDELLSAQGEQKNDKKFILCVGTIENRKNHLNLIKAWLQIASRHNDVKLVIAGSRGWHIEPLEQFIAENKADVERYVEFVYSPDDILLKQLYLSCLFTVYPSFAEGYGLPIVESFQYGKLCLTSNQSSMPEVGGEYADYFNPQDTNSIAAKIDEYLLNKDLLSEKQNKLKDFKALPWDLFVKDIIETIKSKTPAKQKLNVCIDVTHNIEALKQNQTNTELFKTIQSIEEISHPDLNIYYTCSEKSLNKSCYLYSKKYNKDIHFVRDANLVLSKHLINYLIGKKLKLSKRLKKIITKLGVLFGLCFLAKINISLSIIFLILFVVLKKPIKKQKTRIANVLYKIKNICIKPFSLFIKDAPKKQDILAINDIDIYLSTYSQMPDCVLLRSSITKIHLINDGLLRLANVSNLKYSSNLTPKQVSLNYYYILTSDRVRESLLYLYPNVDLNTMEIIKINYQADVDLKLSVNDFKKNVASFMINSSKKHNNLLNDNKNNHSIITPLPDQETGCAVFSSFFLQNTSLKIDVYQDTYSVPNFDVFKNKHNVFSPVDFLDNCHKYDANILVLGNGKYHVNALQIALNPMVNNKILVLHEILIIGAFVELYKDELQINNHLPRITDFKDNNLLLKTLVKSVGIKQVWVNSHSAKKMLLLNLGSEYSGLIKVMFHPVYTSFKPNVVKMNLEGAKYNIGCIGMYNHYKGFDVIKQACKILYDGGLDIKLIFAGYNTSQDIANQDGYNFIQCYKNPAQEELSEIIQKCNLLVQLRSKTYGEVSGVVSEAIYLDKDVIVNKIDSFAEFDESCHQVELGINPEQLAREIKQVLTNEQTQNKLSEARKITREQRSIQNYCKIVEEALQKYN